MAMNFICNKHDGWYTATPYEKNCDNTRTYSIRTYFSFNATLINWCEENFGRGELNRRWWITEYIFWFRNEQDRTFFLLKWQ